MSWLMNFFNKIIVTKKMPDEWRKNILVSIYKNKGDIQSSTNYKGIKLMCHTMKLWEKVIEQRLRHEQQYQRISLVLCQGGQQWKQFIY